MPRTADHAARRAQIVDGARRRILDGGLSAMTVAGTAEAAGVSVGLVQHYFGSKAELLVDTVEAVLQGLLDRVEAEVQASERRSARIETMMFDGLSELLPLDARRRREAYLRHVFAAAALEDADLLNHHRRFCELIRRRIVEAVRNGMECGEVERQADPEVQAHHLHALIDGCAAELLLTDSAAGREAVSVLLQDHLARVFSGTCAREATAG